MSHVPHGIVMFKEESDDLHRGRNHFFKEESTFFKDEPSSFSPCIVSDDYIQEVMDIDEVNPLRTITNGWSEFLKIL